MNEAAGAADGGAEACPGCGARIADPGTVPHPYVGASPGCWALYGDLLAREHGEWGSPAIQRLTVATYAAQHPGERSPKGVQAMSGHLIALHLAVDRGIEPARIARELGRAVADPSRFRWLEPPEPGTWMTILDVRGARDLDEHARRVQRWARSVWEAWSPHHEAIRKWAGR